MSEEQKILSVTELTRAIKGELEARFRSIAVVGEISNFVRHTSGHLYFSIKDVGAQLSCVMFRGSAASLPFSPRNGMEVVCHGNLSVYEPRGSYQLTVTSMRPKGEGALQMAFDELKRRLQAEGMFDVARKRPLPPYPSTIALVSSATGAVLRDLRSVIHRRDPSVLLLVVPVQVQGSGATESIIDGLRQVNAHGEAEVIILARGGGSIEDLWAFNEEAVARAIVASHIPVVSAIGHESDFTIADFAADVRAATPSVAGELVVRDRRERVESLRQVSDTAWKLLDSRRTAALDTMRHAVKRREFVMLEHALRQWSQVMDERLEALHGLMERRMTEAGHSMAIMRTRLAGHDPERILHHGYAIVRRESAVVQSAASLLPFDLTEITFHDGNVTAEIKEVS